MTHNFVNDVLDGGFVAVAELITSGSDLVELIFQKLHEVTILVGRHERDGADESVATHPSLREGVREIGQPLIELLCGLVYGIRARIEMDAVGDITGQEEHSDEICGFHGSSLPLGLRSFNFFGKGLAL